MKDNNGIEGKGEKGINRKQTGKEVEPLLTEGKFLSLRQPACVELGNVIKCLVSAALRCYARKENKRHEIREVEAIAYSSARKRSALMKRLPVGFIR